MKLAVVTADYTPGEADQLRRDIGRHGATFTMRPTGYA